MRVQSIVLLHHIPLDVLQVCGRHSAMKLCVCACVFNYIILDKVEVVSEVLLDL